MKLLRQLLIIAGICLIGEFVNKLTHIPIPGSVLGMIMLFVCLQTDLIKASALEEITRFLLDHLAFFFIPAGVGLIASMGLIRNSALALLTVSLVTTLLVMIATGYTVQFLKRRLDK